jgi:hypothetical protein
MAWTWRFLEHALTRGRSGGRPRRRRGCSLAVEQLESRCLFSASPPLGTIAPTSQTDGNLADATEVNAYALDVTQGGRLTIGVTRRDGSTLDSRVSLFNTTSYVIVDGQPVGGGGLLATSEERAPTDPEPLLSQYVLPGQYFVQVSSAGATGSATGAYTLTTAFAPDASNPYDQSGVSNLLPPVLVGTNPQAIVTADFNRDGVLDLATANRGSGDVSVLLGVGDGTFWPERRYPVYPGDHPGRLVALDFNHDGRPDLAALDSSTGFVDVLLGLGDGTFLADGVIHLPGTDPRVAGLFAGPAQTSVAGDFTRDGNRDVASLVPDGPGTFASQVRFGVGLPPGLQASLDYAPLDAVFGGPLSVAGFLSSSQGYTTAQSAPNPPRDTPQVGDLNGDGILDVLTVSQTGQILVRPGLPGGGFGAPEVVNGDALAREAVIVTTGAHAQVAALSLGQDQVVVYTRSADPTSGQDAWQPTFQAATNHLALRLAAADLDGDGLPDLVVANALEGTLSVYLNQGDGTFRHATDVKVGLTISDVIAAGLTGDKYPDLLVIDQVSGDVGVLVNEGLGPGRVGFEPELRFRAGPPPQGFGTVESPVSAAGNALLDHQFTALKQFLVQQDHFPLYPGSDPAGELLPPLYFDFSSLQTETAVVGDFTGDGIPDVVTLNAGTDNLSLLLGTGTGGLVDPQAALTVPTGDQPVAVVAGDFNGDGRLDLAVLDAGSHDVRVYLGDGHGGFRHTFTVDAGTAPTGLAFATMGGVPNLLVGSAYGDLLDLVGQGDGTFRPLGGGSPITLLAVTEINGRQAFVYASPALDRVAVQYGDGPVDAVPGRGDPLLAPTAVRLADLNGDGIPDLVIANSGANEVLVFLGDRNGDGGFGNDPNSVFRFGTGTDPVGVTVADVTGGGVPDLVVADEGSNDVTLLFGRGQGAAWTMVPGPRLAAGAGPMSTVVEDANGDGIPDILVADNLANEVLLLPGVGNGFFNDRAPVRLRVGAGPVEMLPFDPDGHHPLGVLTVNSRAGTVSILSDPGAFSARLDVATSGRDPVAAVGGDFTHDGFEDLVVANRDDGRLALLLGGPGGLFVRDVLTDALAPTDLALAAATPAEVEVYVADEGRQAVSVWAFPLADDVVGPLAGSPVGAGDMPVPTLQPLGPATAPLVPVLIADHREDLPPPADNPGDPAPPDDLPLLHEDGAADAAKADRALPDAAPTAPGTALAGGTGEKAATGAAREGPRNPAALGLTVQDSSRPDAAPSDDELDDPGAPAVPGDSTPTLDASGPPGSPTPHKTRGADPLQRAPTEGTGVADAGPAGPVEGRVEPSRAEPYPAPDVPAAGSPEGSGEGLPTAGKGSAAPRRLKTREQWRGEGRTGANVVLLAALLGGVWYGGRRGRRPVDRPAKTKLSR